MKIANLSGGSAYYTFNNQKQKVSFPNNESETEMHPTTYCVTWSGLTSNDVIIKQKTISETTYEYSLIVNNNNPSITHNCNEKNNNEINIEAKYKPLNSDEWTLSDNYGLEVDDCNWITDIIPTTTKITYNVLQNKTPNQRQCVFTFEYKNLQSNITIIQYSSSECQKNDWKICLTNETDYNLIKSTIDVLYNKLNNNAILDASSSFILYNIQDAYEYETDKSDLPKKYVGCSSEIEIYDAIKVAKVSDIQFYQNDTWSVSTDTDYYMKYDNENKIIYVYLIKKLKDEWDCERSKLILSTTPLTIPSDVNAEMTPTTTYTFPSNGGSITLYAYLHPYYTVSHWHKWEECDITATITDELDCERSKLILSTTPLTIPSDVNADMTPTTAYTFPSNGGNITLYSYFHPYYTVTGWHKWEECDIVE